MTGVRSGNCFDAATWRCWLLVAWVLIAPAASAQDRIVDRAFLEDPAGRLTFADVQSREFTPYTGPLQRGFSRSVFWVRLGIAGAPCVAPPGAGCAESWVVRIQPSNLDQITLFDSLEPQRHIAPVGDRQPLSTQEYLTLNHNVLIPASAQPRTLWLRLQTRNTKLMDVEVLAFDAALRADQLQAIATSLLICSLALFMTWAGLHWLARRERLLGVMAIDQLVTLLYALAYLGYVRLLVGDRLPPAWLDQWTNVMVVTALPAQLWFHRNFLREMNAPPLGLRMLGALMCLYPLELLALALGYTREALQLNSTLALLVPLLMLAIAWHSGRARGTAPAPLFSRNVLLVMYGLGLAVVWLSIVPILGLLGPSRMTVYSLPAYGFVSGVMLMVILQLRHARMRTVHEQMRTQLQLAQQHVEAEVRQRRQQSEFIDMLTHELKTPLAVLRLSLGLPTADDSVRQRADRAIHDMAAVIDRCALATGIDDEGPASMRDECVLSDLIDDIARSLDGGERIRARLGVDLPPLQTDPALLRTVLVNLLDNALKYAPPASTVELSAEARDAGLRLSVANLPGPAGWPDADRVFQRYYRSAAARRQSGSGLGLYLASALARRLGGRLRYAPDTTHVRFELWLPL